MTLQKTFSPEIYWMLLIQITHV